MRSRRSRQFRELFRNLPVDVKRQAYAAYRLFVLDPRHPSLHFKKLHNTLWSVRVGSYYRALGIMDNPDRIVWIWIGSHAEYDKLIKRLIAGK
jgi:hypothetical protein